MFDLSHDVKLSFNMGNLVPIMCTEAVPGDKFNIGCQSLIRFSPLVSPVMHRMDVTMHYFFVPNRLIWENWENFITNDPDTPAFPYISVTDGDFTDLCDYMGIPVPPPATSPEQVSALPFAAYQMIYNEFYRDQNLIDPIDFALVDGNNNANFSVLTTLRRRAWEHDYFTAALPFAQKGQPVEIPLGTFNDTPVYFNSDNVAVPDGDLGAWNVTTAGGTPLVAVEGKDPTDSNPGRMFAETSLLAPQATTINDLRAAFRLQEWLEKNARAGTRYTESILGHFGVKSPDSRLQRPEYITGVKSPVTISEVLNTTGTDDAPQGNMAGHGVTFVKGNHGSYFCQEHGYIIGIMSLMPKTAYQQGIPKHFLKNDFLDFYWPSFAHLGEQPVLNKEVYAFQGATGDDTFGYVPRYCEYKFEQSRVAGDFRTTLDFWHLGRIFDTPPALNEAFIECVPTDRVFAVTDPEEQKIYAHVYNMVSALRPMPKFGTPMF